ncbi:MAG TPA: TIGR03085 family metal-binding protein [Mycobacteriales bacterium]|nr:TIGR03085 family metal-binding protein [Mycobacteriales bacterium]HWA66924.1 TIGR03085 family metal-binding protein [Mycobacteriales bacterium]
MTSWARAERAELVDLLRRLGPDAPTACVGWTTADMAAHLYVRERRADAGPGVVLGGPFASHTDRVMASVLRVHPYDDVVSRVAAGPPLLLRPVDEQMNLFEFFVHHEDVRRANGEGRRGLPAAFDDVMWERLRRMLRLSLRRMRGTQVEVVSDHGGRAVVGGTGPTVRITGPVGELVLYSFNRKDIAEVELTGDPSAVAALRAARLGI